MKVQQLQEQLSKLDPELEILCYSEDETLLTKDRGLVVLDIVAVNTSEAERLRLDDGAPYLKFGKGPASFPLATLEVTADF